MFKRNFSRLFFLITFLLTALQLSAQEFKTDSVKVIFADGATLSFQPKAGEKVAYSDIIEVLIGIENLADSANKYNGFYALDKPWGKLSVDTKFGQSLAQHPSRRIIENNAKNADFWHKWDDDWDSDWENTESKSISMRDGDGISIHIGHDNVENNKKAKRTRTYWNIDLGLNTYLEDGEIPNNVPYQLDPWGSRYVALSYNWRTQIGKVDKSSFFIKYGLSVSWNNFMFEEATFLTTEENQTNFGPTPTDWDSVKKSKLVVANIGIPVMLQVGRDKSAFQFGIGGYVNYRIDSWQKHKFSIDGDTKKEKDHDSFNLEDFRYGLSTEIGIPKAGFKIFANYELTPLFREGNPELNTVMFGIRI